MNALITHAPERRQFAWESVPIRRQQGDLGLRVAQPLAQRLRDHHLRVTAGAKLPTCAKKEGRLGRRRQPSLGRDRITALAQVGLDKSQRSRGFLLGGFRPLERRP